MQIEGGLWGNLAFLGARSGPNPRQCLIKSFDPMRNASPRVAKLLLPHGERSRRCTSTSSFFFCSFRTFYTAALERATFLKYSIEGPGLCTLHYVSL